MLGDNSVSRVRFKNNLNKIVVIGQAGQVGKVFKNEYFAKNLEWTHHKDSSESTLAAHRHVLRDRAASRQGMSSPSGGFSDQEGCKQPSPVALSGIAAPEDTLQADAEPEDLREVAGGAGWTV